jgi:hypothetical protein
VKKLERRFPSLFKKSYGSHKLKGVFQILERAVQNAFVTGNGYQQSTTEQNLLLPAALLGLGQGE